MSRPAEHVRYGFDEYLAVEEVSNVKHEFLDGHIYAMAGGTPDHAALAASVIGYLFAQLQGSPCRVYDSDLRVRVPSTGLATYPDVTVVCGARETDPEDANTVVNPTVLVEVLSPRTHAYDRGEKFEHYRQIGSLMEYVLVSYGERQIEVVRRSPAGGWDHHVARAGGQAELASIGCELDVDVVYASAADPQ
jgi:Uma2 family endonuclease